MKTKWAISTVLSRLERDQSRLKPDVSVLEVALVITRYPEPQSTLLTLLLASLRAFFLAGDGRFSRSVMEAVTKPCQATERLCEYSKTMGVFIQP